MTRFAFVLSLASALALPVIAQGQQSSQQSQQARQRRQQQMQQRQQQQQQQQQQQRQQWQQQQRQQQQTQSAQNVLLEGEVIDADTLELQGHDYQHVFATVRSEHSGQTFLVDLGTESELGEIEIRAGQQIAITGRKSAFKESPVIVAEEVRQGDQSVTITRQGPADAITQTIQMQDCPLCAAKAQQQLQPGQQQWQRRQQMMGQGMAQQQSISGTLIEARSIQLRGQQERHVVAKIQTDSGQTIIADLGPRRTLRDFQPSPGSQIEISGIRGTINGKPVILAQRASSSEQSITIPRSAQSMQTRQGQQQQQRRQQLRAQMQPGQTQDVQGRLISTVAMDFGALSPTYVLGTLETQSGERVLVDFGTLQDIQDAQLRLGEDLSARGRVTELNGVPMVIARQITDDGQSITIDRQSPDVEQAIQDQQSSQQPQPQQGKGFESPSPQ